MVVLDSHGKECDAVVNEVSIRDNALKLLIHYVGRSERQDEWILATHKRIISKPKFSPKNAYSASDVPSEFPIDLAGKIGHFVCHVCGKISLNFKTTRQEKVLGSILRIDEKTRGEDQLVLVEVCDDNKLNLTLYLWSFSDVVHMGSVLTL